MAQAKKGLGRGLAALIPNDDMNFLSGVARGDFDMTAIADNASKKSSTPAERAKVAKTSTMQAGLGAMPAISATDGVGSATVDSGEEPSLLQWLTADAIVANPYQPRRVFDDEELQNLADSVREHGILQPIIVRPLDTINDEGPRFQLVAGERRWRAAQLAGLNTVPAIVRPVSDQQALELAVIENVQRHDISPLDAAQAYRRLAIEFELSQEKIAQRVGKSRSAIANTMRLLELPVEARNALQDGSLSEGHGRAILLAPGEGARRAAFRAVLRDKLSVRDTEELARRIAAGEMPPAEAESSTDTQRAHNAAAAQLVRAAENTDFTTVAEQIQNSTGCRVQFRPRRRGGQFVIHCSSADDVARLVNLIQARD